MIKMHRNLLIVSALLFLICNDSLPETPLWAMNAANDSEEVEQAIHQANSLSMAFREASKKVIPFVVKIETTSNAVGDLGVYDMFPFGPRSRGGGAGLGTGIIVQPDGVILTNNHVIEDADKILVILSDGREFDVKETITDKSSDLAILKLNVDEQLPCATFADSDTIEVGDWVLAIGNPFDLESTVSVGIISARWRPLVGVDRGDFLQTDAAINPGNSGGPLVNLRGEVIGINTAIASRTGSNSGIGFANASNTAKWVMQQLLEKGKVERAYLGVGIAAVDAKLAAKLGGKPREGVYVNNVIDKDYAQNNGLKKDDIILAFDGIQVNSPSQLQSIVERAEVDKPHNLKVLRDKQVAELSVRVAHDDRQSIFKRLSESAETKRSVASASHADAALGIRLMQMNPEYARQKGFEARDGVVIWNVDSGKRGERAGIKVGMYVNKINDVEIATLDDYIEARKNSSLKDGITLVLQSAEGEKTITMKQ